MPLNLLLLLLFLSAAATTTTTTAGATTTTTVSGAHKELLSYGFPVGLLPKNIKSYVINQTSGEFFVEFGDTCRITLPPDNYLASYSKKVSGKIVDNRIAELDGISVRAFYKWWGITGIKASGDNLVFEVGMVTAKYPSNSFHSIPECEGKRSSS